jgi:hypothetical protein
MGDFIYDLTAPVYEILPDPEKFEKMNWAYRTELVTKKDYPFLNFLPDFDSTFMPVDTMARYPGGIDSLLRVFIRNFVLVKKYYRRDEEYYARISLLIDETGSLSVIKNKDPWSALYWNSSNSFYKDVVQAIKETPQWLPAICNGKPVSNHLYLDVKFRRGFLIFSLLNRNPLDDIPDNGTIPIPDNRSRLVSRPLPIINL